MQHPPFTHPGFGDPSHKGQTQPLPALQPQQPGAPLAVPPQEQPIRDLVSQLSQDGSLLIKQEIALAKQELKEKAGRLGTQGKVLAAGGVALYTGTLALVAALILLLAEAMPAWVAALLVGLTIATVGAILLLRGKNNLEKLDLKPSQTLKSVEQDLQAVKEAAHGT